MNTKLIFLYFILVVLLIDASLCENRKQEKKQKKLNKRIHQNSNYTIETCNITNNTNQNTFVLRTSRSKEELEEVIRKAHLTMLKHKHKNKKAKKQEKKEKKENKKVAKNGTPTEISTSQNNTITPIESKSTNNNNNTISDENITIKDPVLHVQREEMDEPGYRGSLNGSFNISEEEMDEEDYYQPIDEFAQIKIEQINEAQLHLMKFNSKEIEMKDDSFGYASTLLIFIIVLALAVLGIQLLFGNSQKKQGDYLLLDENQNEFTLQYNK